LNVAVSAVSDSLDAQIDPRFGRCQYFVIVDSDTINFEAIPNTSQTAPSGAGIQAAQTIANKGVKLVLTGSVGPNAYQVLSSAGINIITGVNGTVREAVEKFKRGQLQETTTTPTPATGFGIGRGYGMGIRRVGGRGKARGIGRGRGMGMGGFAPSTHTVVSTTPITQTPPVSKEKELIMLENQMKSLQQQLDQIKKKIKELSTSK